MKKQKILPIILILLFTFELAFADSWSLSSSVSENNQKADSTSFLWIAKSRTAKILDNFNERQQVLLFENVPISSQDEGIIFDSDSKVRSLEDMLKKINDRKEILKTRKRNVTKQKFNLKNAIEELDKSIADTEDSIKTTENDISNKNSEIIDLTKKIGNINEKILENKKTILNYLTYIYSKWDWLYWDNNDIDVIRSIILNDGNLWDLLNDIHFKSLIELSWQNLIDAHRDLVKEYYYNKEEFKKQKLELLRLKNELKSKNEDLNSQKTYKQELLDETRWQEALYNKFIAQKAQSEDSIKEKIDNVNVWYNDLFNNIWNKYNCNIKFGSWWIVDIWDAQPNESQKCTDIRRYFTLEKKLRESGSDLVNTANPFLWPAEPSRWISTYFHDEWYYASLWSEHEAIDIRMTQWTSLVAPTAGYVYFVSPPGPGKYAYIALKHADWFVTVYWHVSEILVNQFDFVEAGQVFAKSGWAPGTPWAWPMTSWAHLHFELFKDRENIDPLRYFDTTHLRFDDLPTKYRYKYIEDLKLKYGNKINMDKFQRFYIAWESEIERQKYLLDTYASPEFKNWNMWVEESVGWKIDPSFLMCVWLAETWLWKHLKTWYNVGNIGNTDSWWTYQFDSAREWIYWMAKTLNNKYLYKYSSIDMLSRWWNKDWSIYASSSKNWHNNVIKCLSSLKWRFVEDDYKFRVINSDD